MFEQIEDARNGKSSKVLSEKEISKVKITPKCTVSLPTNSNVRYLIKCNAFSLTPSFPTKAI